MAIEAPRKLSPASVAAESPAMEVEGLTLTDIAVVAARIEAHLS